MPADYRAVTHIALNVPSLREAEEFYRQLFRLDVAFRETERPDGWWTLPREAGWTDAEAAGVTPQLSVLQRDALALALEAGEAADGSRLNHIGLQVSGEEMERLRRRAPGLHCQVLADRPDLLVLLDPYAVQWELSTNPSLVSTGDRTGRWLDLKGMTS